MNETAIGTVPLGSDPLSELDIPDGTTVEEHDLVTDGDVIVGGQSTVEFGVRGRTVIADERVRFGGHIEAEGDCRLDMWCDVADNVLVGEDAYNATKSCRNRPHRNRSSIPAIMEKIRICGVLKGLGLHG